MPSGAPERNSDHIGERKRAWKEENPRENMLKRKLHFLRDEFSEEAHRYPTGVWAVWINK